MNTAHAAYCSTCRTYVFVAPHGGCEMGHPRSSLRGIYVATVEKRTGRPLPPSGLTRESLAYPAPPVAPVAESVPQMSAPVAASTLAGMAAPGASSNARGFLGRLFGAGRGRHSSNKVTLLGTAPRGRHSAGAARRSA